MDRKSLLCGGDDIPLHSMTESKSIQYKLSFLITAVKASFFRHCFTILTLCLLWV